MNCPDATVILRDWSCRSGTDYRLKNIDMQLPPGQICLLYGANGAGKSSLLKLLAGLLSHQSGWVMSGEGHVLGQPLLARSGQDRARLGYMPQQGGLYEELSAVDNLHFRAQALDLPHAQSRVQNLVDAHGLGPVLRRRVSHLSGGWRQRVAFAVALLAQPRLLLLDEPTAGVDLDAKAQLWEHIHRLAHQGVSVLISTHDTQEVMSCHALMALAHGRVCHTGSPMALAQQAGGLEQGLRRLLRQGAVS
ncbi:ATP-binding cassette domain-containing protein [Limnohabitans sp. DM1]|uniref:ATP-binding cassette domain-containing protein n=1 Tax=Limnohabitans sp. DM1 TaxID=1597955 RepID=UPI000A90709A|nr:ABC transporter ATP-binding protein [Limnohabitans sp. DM1]